MPLHINSRSAILNRVRSDKEFAQALLDEGIRLFIEGKPETENNILKTILAEGIESIETADIHEIVAEAHKTIKMASCT